MEHLKGMRLFDTIKDASLKFQCMYKDCPNSCCKNFHTVEIGFEEIFSLSRYFVIHFPYDSANGRFIGNAIVGFVESKTGCVFLRDGVGCMLGDDRPLFCKSYPFFVHPDTSRLIIDPACPGFSEVEGALIYENNSISEEIKREYIVYGIQLVEDVLKMREFTKFLADNDLLVSGNIEIRGKSVQVNLVNEGKLLDLDKDTMEEAINKGYMKAIYAHLNSFKNVDKLARRVADMEGGDEDLVVL